MPDSTEVSDFEQLAGSSLNAEHPVQPQGIEADSTSKPKRGWKRWLRRIAVSGIVLVGLLAGGAYLLLQLAAVEPEFYKQALHVDPAAQKKYGSEMEAKMLDLRNSVLASESWSVTFSEDQINGWLAWDLQKKFPSLLPPEASDPRVKLGKQSATFAFRCDAKPFRGIAIVEADVFMTGIVNQVGIRIKSIRSGMVPIPVAVFADQIAEQARKSNLEIEWLTEEGDPVAIVDLPDELIRPAGNFLEVQLLEISEKEFRLAGATHPEDY